MHKSVEIALNEVGYLEKQNASCLDDKVKNAGEENFTKYARDMDARIGFYRGKKQGLPWCDVFVDWCFVRAYGRRRARRMLCQPLFSRGAGCRYSFAYYQKAGRAVTEPQEGDQIFFIRQGVICHTGLVVAVDEEYVHTVEGNTSDASGIVANGGGVSRKRYLLTDTGIAGYGRPRYENT